MIYYLEVNLICIIILLIFMMQLRQKEGSLSAGQNLLRLLIGMTILFCCADLAAGVLRGRQFPYARTLIEISNLLYYEMLLIISFLWSLYVYVRLTKNRSYVTWCLLLWSLPALLFTVTALTNPFTHFLFGINEANLYERSTGIYLHWAVVWTYFLVPTVYSLKAYLQEKHRLKRQEILPLLYFAIAPAAASVIQMLFYGVTTTQVGITISLVLICLSLQKSQMLTDALTGINNRRGLEQYLTDSMQRGLDVADVLLMIDVDNFKSINDRYGHMTGDLVLQSVAASLKDACRVITSRLFLCRFGGDEFVIFGVQCSDEEISCLTATIISELRGRVSQDNLPADLTLSIGTAAGSCNNEKEFRDLLARADEAMYREKATKRSQQQNTISEGANQL